MKKQNGNIAFMLVFALVIAVGALTAFTSYVTYNNYGAAMDASLKAEWTNNQNILSAYTLKLKEAAHVPDKYKADLKDIVTATFQGRYGENGSQATMQWIRENNLPLDSKMYVQLQQIIESGRNEFKTSQTKLIDIKRQYEVAQQQVWSGFWLKQVGFPKVPLDTYKVIIDQSTTQQFKTGVAEEVKF